MSIDTVALLIMTALGAALGAAITAIGTAASIKTDVEWLKRRMLEISRQLDHLQAQRRA